MLTAFNESSNNLLKYRQETQSHESENKSEGAKKKEYWREKKAVGTGMGKDSAASPAPRRVRAKGTPQSGKGS